VLNLDNFCCPLQITVPAVEPLASRWSKAPIFVAWWLLAPLVFSNKDFKHFG